jgi:hypothetical protein
LTELDSTRLEEQVTRLEALVADQAKRLQALEGHRPDGEGGRPQRAKAPSRRELLKLAGAAVVGAAGVAGAGVLNAMPASAADGANLVLGSAASNFEESPTTLYSDQKVTATSILTLNGVAYTAQVRCDGLYVIAQQGGIAGNFNAAAYGTVGPDVYLSGSGRLVQFENIVGTSAPNFTPASNALESLRGANGSFWMSRASSGIPIGALQSAWKRMNTVRVDSSDGTGSPFKPYRVIDTRSGAIKPAGGTPTLVTVAGEGSGTSNIPADAVAIVGNLTAVGYAGGGFLAIMPGGITVGVAVGDYNPAKDPSSVNFIVGQKAIANGFICGLVAGKVQVYVAGHSSHFIIDVTGYMQ